MTSRSCRVCRGVEGGRRKTGALPAAAAWNLITWRHTDSLRAAEGRRRERDLGSASTSATPRQQTSNAPHRVLKESNYVSYRCNYLVRAFDYFCLEMLSRGRFIRVRASSLVRLLLMSFALLQDWQFISEIRNSIWYLLQARLHEIYFFPQKGCEESLAILIENKNWCWYFGGRSVYGKSFCFDKVQTSFHRLHRPRAWLNNCKDCFVSNVKKRAYGSVI